MSHLDEGILHALLDGEIPSSELAPIQAHLEACAACRARLDEQRELLSQSDTLVELLEVPEVDADAPAPRIRPARVRTGSWVRNLAWAASILGAVGLGYAAGSRAPGSPALGPSESARGFAPVSRREDTAVSQLADRAAPPAVVRESSAGRAAPSGPRAKASLLKDEVVAEVGKRSDSTALNQPPATPPPQRVAAAAEATPAPAPPAAAPGAGFARQRIEPMRLDERRAGNAALGLTASKTAADLAPAEPILLPDAIRRLGGSLRLIEGMVPLRLESQGPYVRVVYPLAQGELVLQQQLIDGRVVHALLAPEGFPADSLTRLRARVRE